ncbi:hypothetical protein [Oceanibaculum pacificum]|uniref:Anti-sigma factor NepR domain-containing protein n=1 Tax=Oceanibaculum pacificum TaxID=580166 RepID=A0A154VUQ4_9PROT|nr:hypothetical protein [Oceanibaculum pacificum]KZD04911.1 hypothetical protein AUP43_11950 [Oceanibaculum pacificum]
MSKNAENQVDSHEAADQDRATLDNIDASTKKTAQVVPFKPSGKRPANAQFDEWLTRNLHELYDPVLKEPLPEMLQKLLDSIPDKKD